MPFCSRVCIEHKENTNASIPLTLKGGGVLWVGQCLEHDIAVQADRPDGVRRELQLTIEAHQQLHNLHKVPRPPASATRRRGAKMIKI